SSSSTLNNLLPTDSQHNQNNVVSGEEEKEETVTETIKTQEIQTTFRQIGQHLDDSAFFIPLGSSSRYHELQKAENRNTNIPLSRSPLSHEEKPAIQHL
ncbi:unnamed protein product, partial [Rotaria sp. Silwood2]